MRPLLSLSVVVFALGFCGRTSGDDKDEIAKCVKDLKSTDLQARLKAVEKLTECGEGAARPLCDAMLDTNRKVAQAALVGVEKVSPKLYKPLATMALDKDVNNVRKALVDIYQLGKEARPAFGYLVARYKSEAKREQAGTSINNYAGEYLAVISVIGGDSEECVTFFKAVATSTHPTHHEAVIWLVEWAGADMARRKEVVPVIKARISDKAGAEYFIELAGKYGALSKDMLPALKKLKLSKEMTIRDAATKAVELIEAP